MVNSHKCLIPLGTSRFRCMERSMGMRLEGPTSKGVQETHVQMLCILQLLAHKLWLVWSCDQFTSFLGDGFKYFLFSPLLGEMIQIGWYFSIWVETTNLYRLLKKSSKGFFTYHWKTWLCCRSASKIHPVYCTSLKVTNCPLKKVGFVKGNFIFQPLI